MRNTFRGRTLLVAFAITAVAVFLLFAPGRAQNADNSITALGDAVTNATKAYSAIRSYDAEVWLQERINGQVRPEERVHSVYVKSPVKMYFHWLPGGGYAGLQSSYVADRDGPNEFFALETGVAGWVGVRKYAFDSLIIKKFYPHQYVIKNYHMGFLLSRLAARNLRATELNMIKVTVGGPPSVAIPGRRLRVFTCEFTPNFPVDPVDGVRYRRTVIGFDEQTSLPLYIETYDGTGQFYARYKYMKFTANPNIPDSLFELQR